jgi:hypothetical protein
MSNHQRFLRVLIALTSAWLAACDHHSSGTLSPSSALTSVQITNWELLTNGYASMIARKAGVRPTSHSRCEQAGKGSQHDSRVICA